MFPFPLGCALRNVLLFVVASSFTVPVLAENPAAVEAESLDFFERKIRPVLVQHCYECHSAGADLVQGGLRLDERDAMLRGGDTGAAVQPGQPGGSLLLAALRYDGVQMPPDQPLPKHVLRDFETWIRSGAAMPKSTGSPAMVQPAADNPIDWDRAREFWAFQKPALHEPSEIDAANKMAADNWSERKLDRFVVARLAEQGIAPNEPAVKQVWLRRVSFDLIGLPPTFEQVEEFIADDSPLAKQRVVDRLLASPANAERWTRLWLDVARYAEDQAHIVGNNSSLTYPNAYLYRDWVIAALAADMPYDEFVRLQLAADLIHPDDPSSHVALGFMGLGPKYYRRNDLEVMADEWEDRIDTVTRGLLGLTVACARCHDHKFDPIPTTDYYALAGVFASTEMFNRPLDDSVETKGGQAKNPDQAIHIIREGKPHDLNVMIRGDAKRLGPQVERRFLSVIAGSDPETFDDGSGRRELAQALTDRSNPLAARVIVNRIWDQLMGAPLVGTPSNFGALGSLPTHPLLLDDLAVRFMAADWSIKWLQREIVLSATYGQSSHVDPVKSELDPDNQWRWRMPRRRLSVEAYRDSILAVSGQLDAALQGRSIEPDDVAANRRTVYSKVSRLDLNPMLARFDFPDPNAHSPGRHETTTPLQKLFLLNSPFLVHYSSKLAGQVVRQDATDADQIMQLYRRTYGREPNDDELQLAITFVSDCGDEGWKQLAQALLVSNEMFLVD
ncbi:PSD1 and planctomycete cytochrome C domain-containing protein [Stieleria sp. TO1_6]|uniref:PSD1 and planctomycete cytochrome C domain-containing protein n=1 Tax=Stieleria tagensis TaxID=2956795 RepID=UPI00209AA5F3|nr:PSD1 and planctomycete cytochrome C domain-containing protein [Stieleria tagensis]MCO8122096.1 PSD1 and planctomycete cytochrome C domain-containing protein [Stieleria tagensis]